MIILSCLVVRLSVWVKVRPACDDETRKSTREQQQRTTLCLSLSRAHAVSIMNCKSFLLNKLIQTNHLSRNSLTKSRSQDWLGSSRTHSESGWIGRFVKRANNRLGSGLPSLPLPPGWCKVTHRNDNFQLPITWNSLWRWSELCFPPISLMGWAEILQEPILIFIFTERTFFVYFCPQQQTLCDWRERNDRDQMLLFDFKEFLMLSKYLFEARGEILDLMVNLGSCRHMKRFEEPLKLRF